MRKVYISVPTRQYRFGQEVKPFILSILPDHVAAIAAATCSFELQGKESIGNEWGLGVATKMQTFGMVPAGFSEISFSRCGNWITAHNKAAARVVLSPFGLTLEEVLAFYGTPPDGEKYSLTLFEAVKTLYQNSRRPEIRNLEFAA